jgi:acyl-CoA dehydrogenase
MTDRLFGDRAAERAALRRFVERTLTPHAAAWEARGRFPRSILRTCASAGLLTLDPWRSALVAEELPRAESLGFALSVFVQGNLVAPLVDRLGTADQRRQHLRPVLAGRACGAVAVSEPGAGSDYAALVTTADRARGHLTVHGTKTYITNAAIADFFIVAAREDAGPATRALTLVLVPAGARGVRVRSLPTLGLRTSAMGEIRFTRCRVPVANMLGESGAAFGYLQGALDRERLFGALAAVSWADHALKKTILWARERRAFGQPIVRHQAVRHRIADLATRLEAARQLNYATFARWVDSEDVTREIAMIKVFSYQAAQEAIEACLQLHGGAGYLDSHWTSRFYRDARALTIAAGTPEVMKDLIAAYLRL